MVINWTRVFVLAASAMLAGAPQASAQATIPELVEQANESLGRTIDVETGPPPSIQSVLRTTDVIVRGTVGKPTSYLSDDNTTVYSDYPIVNAVMLYPPAQMSARRPGPAPVPPMVTITHIGGVITVSGHEFTMEHRALPPLVPGTQGVFLLKKTGDHFTIAGTFYGAFEIDGDRLSPLARLEGYGEELKHFRVDAAVQWLLARKQDVQRTPP
jgi:hypothetical protein